jgi:cytochrome c peroxidase
VVQLGRLLFYDPIASRDRQTACATCHSEIWGMTDGLERSIGLGGGLFTGPGRAGANVLRRNAPTLWNTAFGEVFLWDGRAASLEEQVRLPFESVDELARPLDEVITEVAALPAYASLFAAAFPGEEPAVTADTYSRAVAAFERTLVSRRGRYDAYVAGDANALDDEMKRGLFLFAEVGCVNCHVPPLFASDRFEDRGVSAVPGILDRGRAEVTDRDADVGAFKVPTLRNLQESGPYFHTGEITKVAAAVKHEVDRSEAEDGARPLTDDETDALAAFVEKALFDRRNNPTRPGKVPSGLSIPIDGIGVRR